MLKGKDIFTFVRFGGLDLKNQRGFSQDPETYHQPPAIIGIYSKDHCEVFFDQKV